MLAAYGAQWASGTVTDWTATGTITYFNVAGPGSTFELTLLRKGKAQVQRIAKQPWKEVFVYFKHDEGEGSGPPAVGNFMKQWPA